MAPLKYQGCSLFRSRITSSLLSGNTLKVDKIREKDDSPGLQDYEANYLRLIEKITDGCKVEINTTGTAFRFAPGILLGGKITHDCGLTRSIGWFIEGILPLAVFCKHPLELTLTGITNDSLDISVDILRAVTLPLLMNFGIMGVTMKVKRRGAAPKGGGIVEMYIPIVRSLKPIHITEEGLVKKVRGVAFCTKISPTIVTRVIDSCRGVLNHLLPDVHIHTDHYKGKEGGDAPGYSLSLVAETTTGVLLSIERTANTRGVNGGSDSNNSANNSNNGEVVRQGGELPEDIGKEGALMLLSEIQKGGVIDSTHQSLILMLMILTPEDVSKVRFGELTPQAIGTLRLLKDAFGVVFKIKKDDVITTSYIDNPSTVSKKGKKQNKVSSTDEEDHSNDNNDSDNSNNSDNNNDDDSSNEDDENSEFSQEDMDVDSDEADSVDENDDDDDEEEDDSQNEDGGFEEISDENQSGDEGEDSDDDNDKVRGANKVVSQQKVVTTHSTVLLSCFGIGFTNVNRRVT